MFTYNKGDWVIVITKGPKNYFGKFECSTKDKVYLKAEQHDCDEHADKRKGYAISRRLVSRIFRICRFDIPLTDDFTPDRNFE